MAKLLILSRSTYLHVITLDNNNRICGYQKYLHDLDKVKHKNIYIGKISRVVKSLNSLFVTYDKHEKDALLPLTKISDTTDLASLQPGKNLIIQIIRESYGSKGALATNHIAISGRYLVIYPFKNLKGNKISKNITVASKRTNLLKLANTLNDAGNDNNLIFRTSCNNVSHEEIIADYNLLVALTKNVLKDYEQKKDYQLLYQEQSIISSIVNDCLSWDIEEIQTIDQENHKKIRNYLKKVNINIPVKFVNQDKCFEFYDLYQELKSLDSNIIILKSGGSIHINETEALTAIDINSYRSVQYDDIEKTAFNTNIEAIEKIARHLILRQLSGLIIIDLIDMKLPENIEQVEKFMMECFGQYKVNITISKISKLGLVEMSIQSPIKPGRYIKRDKICDLCGGSGKIKNQNEIIENIIFDLEEKISHCNKHNQLHQIIEIQISSTNHLKSKLERLITKNKYRVKNIVIKINDIYLSNQYSINYVTLSSNNTSDYNLTRPILTNIWLQPAKKLWNWLIKNTCVTNKTIANDKKVLEEVKVGRKIKQVGAPKDLYSKSITKTNNKFVEVNSN